MSSDIKMQDNTCAEFVRALGSKQSTPGGGGAAAMLGALGIALGDMVACFTIGKPKYAAVDGEMQQLRADAERLEARFLELMEEDAAAFAPLAKAYGMPKDTPEQKAEKDRVMEECLHRAAMVPLDIMLAAGRALELLDQFAAKGSAMMVSDAGCGAAACMACLQAAALNVRINTRSMKDRDYARQMDAEIDHLLARYVPLAQKIYAEVDAQCR